MYSDIWRYAEKRAYIFNPIKKNPTTLGHIQEISARLVSSLKKELKQDEWVCNEVEGNIKSTPSDSGIGVIQIFNNILSLKYIPPTMSEMRKLLKQQLGSVATADLLVNPDSKDA